MTQCPICGAWVSKGAILHHVYDKHFSCGKDKKCWCGQFVHAAGVSSHMERHGGLAVHWGSHLLGLDR